VSIKNGAEENTMWMSRAGIAAVLVVAALPVASCAGTDDPQTRWLTTPVKIDEGTIAGRHWSLFTFRNGDGETCYDLREGDATEALSGGCGPWTDDPASGRYMVGLGPGDNDFAYGPLTAGVAAVEATAPGHTTITVPAKAMPTVSAPPTGVPPVTRYFVIPIPGHAATWTFRARDAAGATQPFGP
jgi:hypothetical protein